MLNYLRYVTAVAILLCGVHTVTAQTNLLYKGKGQRAAIKEKRDTAGINPFKKAARVEFVAIQQPHAVVVQTVPQRQRTGSK